MRLVLGVTSGAQGACYFADREAWSALSLLAGALLVAAGVGILMGLLTPVAAGASALIAAGSTLSLLPLPGVGLLDAKLPAILTACMSISLAFLGPGAFSIDAKLFGRREIVIPPARPHE